MVNYNNSIIYKLCCKNPEITDIYIGSTTNFTKRKQKHKSDCNNINSKKYNYNVYKFIRDNNGWNNWDMVLIEEYSCNNKLELHKKERDILEQLGATLNICIPNRNRKEYDKQYRENNKEYYKEQRKEYYEDNKEYYKEKNKEKNKKHYDNNKEYLKEKVECKVCGKSLSRSSLNLHNKRFHN